MSTAGSSSQQSQDVFSLSDQVLSEKLEFIEEIGFGNWGSVWLCKPKTKSQSSSHHSKIAVKLVHRSKTPTTAARVRSLWNEMKIIRSFKEDPHPSVIPFHSFIITPSFALITMAYLPTLVPVEVPEDKCKEWFRSLLSGVEFLHKRGVVHNDIKPANILLSPERVPVLVDFGFAEKYDVQSSKAFHSNLSYGTPEYLSPERARGLPHDTRKSDIWSLGVTFFEILVGRTPFEGKDGEQLTTKEDLERYWGRTMKGKWLGTWSFSKGAEKLLKRMIAPNADLRCNASDAFADAYWNRPRDTSSTHTLHRRAISATSSLTSNSSQERDSPSSSSTRSRLVGALSPWSRSLRSKKAVDSSPSLQPYDATSSSPSLKLAKSVANLRRTTSKQDIKPRIVPKPRAPLNVLSPIKASPPTTPRTNRTGKENTPLRPKSHYASPLGQPTQTRSDESMRISRHKRVLSAQSTNSVAPVRAPLDLTAMNRHLDNVVEKRKERKGDKVNQRVLDWEREKERLREMSRLEELERDTDNDEAESVKSSTFSKISRGSTPLETPAPEELTTPTTPPSRMDAPSTPSSSDLGIRSFAHNLSLSLSKTVERYKNSLNQPKSPTRTESSSFDFLDDAQFNISQPVGPDALDTTLPVIRTAMENERASMDNQADRLMIWMRNVEKVVEDTRQNFASSSKTSTLPGLPIAPPVSRSASAARNTNRSSRFPRKALAASQIFTAMDEFGEVQRVGKSLDLTLISDASAADATIGIDSVLRTPTRPRRATVSAGSPQRLGDTPVGPDSPSRSRSHANLLQRHIVSPESMRKIEENRLTPQKTPKAARLSAVIDPSLFVAPTSTSRFRENLTLTPEPPRAMTPDELSASPCIVEPYPARKPLGNSTIGNFDSPTTQKRVEGVFDRYLMTTGVKRLGAGYQSTHTGPVAKPMSRTTSSSSAKENVPNENDYNVNAVRRRSSKLFLSNKRQMPPPVSSDDFLKPPCSQMVDEMGMMNASGNGTNVFVEGRTPMKDGATSVSVMRRAFRAMSTNRKVSSRA